MTPDTILRDGKARHEAMLRYAKAHDTFAELEQRLKGEGKDIEAEGAHQMGLIAVKAWLKERDDPAPVDPDDRSGDAGR